MSVTAADLLLAILLFYFVNWLGAHSSVYRYLQLSLFSNVDQAPAFNFILKALTPSVFIIIVATGFYALHLDKLTTGVWLVAAYYFAFRLLFNLILGRGLLLSYGSFGFQTIVGVGAAYITYRYLILPRKPLFPNLQTIGDQMWIIVALFLYAALNSIRTSDAPALRRKNKYLRARYASLRNQYGDLIEGQLTDRFLELVAYAVLIHEDFNRPWAVRVAERAVFPWASHTIGPMQVRTQARLSDRDSVYEGVRQLQDCLESAKGELHGKQSTQYELIRVTLAKFHRDEHYLSEIFTLLYMLWNQVAPQYEVDFRDLHQRRALTTPSQPA